MEKKKMEENKESHGVNPAHLLLKKLHDKKDIDELHIGRLPLKTKKAFISLAKEEFCNDYGWLLKWLMDGIPNHDVGILAEKIEELETRILNLEAGASKKSDEPKKEIRRMLDGSKKEVKKNGTE